MADSPAAPLFRPGRVLRRLQADRSRMHISAELTPAPSGVAGSATSVAARAATTASAPTVQVLWNETWYQAEILDRRPGATLVAYSGHDGQWERWVDHDSGRLRPQHVLTRPETLDALKGGRFPKPGDIVACLSVCHGEAGCFQSRRITPVGIIEDSRPEWDASLVRLTQIHATFRGFYPNRVLFVVPLPLAEEYRRQLRLIRRELGVVARAARE